MTWSKDVKHCKIAEFHTCWGSADQTFFLLKKKKDHKFPSEVLKKYLLVAASDLTKLCYSADVTSLIQKSSVFCLLNYTETLQPALDTQVPASQWVVMRSKWTNTHKSHNTVPGSWRHTRLFLVSIPWTSWSPQKKCIFSKHLLNKNIEWFKEKNKFFDIYEQIEILP